MHGDARTHIGLMAQDVEKKYPESVGLAGGYKFVDYGQATEEAANRGHFYAGGVVPIRTGLAVGGMPYSPGAISTGIPMASGHGALGTAGPTPGTGHMGGLVGLANGSGVNRMARGGFADGGYSGPYGDLSSILATQENMYQPNQTRNRNIPTQTAQNHQLAVASGSPTPPPSGASNVQTSIGLGKDVYSLGSKGYNMYQNSELTPVQISPNAVTLPESGASSPVAAPSSGLAGGADAGASTAADTAGLAGADTVVAPAAADAAAAAAPVAADAAGTAAAGAAGTAVAGAATDAAATEAASLAAEYAIGDAAIAALAAKRGGRIKRPGLDAGGVPYEADVSGNPYSAPGGQMDIPDVQGADKLQTAGPLKKQPTGFQDALQMGNIMNAGSTIGSVFSNQGLGSKQGGRIKKDGGGGLGDAPDDSDLSPITIDPNDHKLGLSGADILPEQTVTAERPDPVTYSGGVTPSDVSVAAPKPPDVGPNAPTTWSKIMDGLHAAGLDKATNVVPLLTGLAAMGTAPTRHLGVALAAGLGAGAQAYLPAQQQGAEIQRTQAQAQQIGLQNQITRGAIQGMPGGRPQMPEPMRPPGMVSGDPTDPQEVAFSRYAPLPTARPDSVNQQVTAMSVLRPATAKFVGDQYDQMVQGANQRRQQGANAGYQSLLEVNSAQPGQALSALAKSPIPEAQQKATQLQQSGADPATLDQQARAYAQQLGLGTHQYTTRGTDVVNGVMIDKPTNAPVLGSSQVMTGLTPEAKSAAFDEAVTPKTYGAGLPEAPYRHFGFASPEAYVIAKDRAARLSGVPSAAPTGTTAPPSGPSAPTRSGAPGAPPGVAAPLGRASTPPMLPGVNINSIPKLPAPSPATDQVSLNKANKQTDQNLEIQKEALAPLKTQTETAARNTAIYSQLEKTLANSDPREFGPSSSTYRALANFKTYLSGIPPDGLVNLNEADKYLAQLGVPGSKQLLGSDQQLRQQELLMLMAHANPNIDQPLQVIKNLAAFGKAGNSYDLLAGNTAIAAIRHGADPIAVPGAIEGQVHRADYIQQQLGVPFAPPAHPGTGRTVVRTGIYNGKKVTQYSDGTIE